MIVGDPHFIGGVDAGPSGARNPGFYPGVGSAFSPQPGTMRANITAHIPAGNMHRSQYLQENMCKILTNPRPFLKDFINGCFNVCNSGDVFKLLKNIITAV